MDEDEIEKMQTPVSSFPEQLIHYEMYHWSAFPKAAMNRLSQSISGTCVSQDVVIVMPGISKVSLREVVAAALDVCEKWRERPPLQPKHLKEAAQRLKSMGQIPNLKHTEKHLLLTKPRKDWYGRKCWFQTSYCMRLSACFTLSVLHGFHDEFNVFINTQIFITPRRRYPACFMLP